MQSTKFELEGTATIGKASLLSFSAMQFSVMILYLALRMHEIQKVEKYFQLLDSLFGGEILKMCGVNHSSYEFFL